MIIISSLNEYQLITMSEEERNELVELRIKEGNEQLNFFNKRLNEKIDSFKADASQDIKMLMAFNQLFEREYSQHNTYSLEGYEDITKVIRDKTLFINNNYKFKEDGLASDQTVYLVIEPEVISSDIGTENGTKLSTNKERIMQAIKKFDDYGISYNLNLYINTDSYDTHRIILEDIRSTVAIPFEVVSLFEVSPVREVADIVVTTIPTLTIDKLLDGFLLDTGLYLDKKKKIYFDFTPSSKPPYISTTDFLLLADKHLSNLLLEENTDQAVARRATEIWLDKTGSYKHIYETIDDFLNIPGILTIKGLSRFYGFIRNRIVEVNGYSINEETMEEQPAKVKFDNPDDLEFVNDDELLLKLMMANPKNLFTNLIRVQGNIIRVDTYQRTLVVMGKNLDSPLPSSQITLTEKFDNVILLSHLYAHNYYKTFLNINKQAIQFKLPNRFETYMRRIAHSNGHVSEKVDTRWFSNNSNINLSQIIADLDGKVSRDLLLRNYISPKEGILSKHVSVKTEDIRWISRKS